MTVPSAEQIVRALAAADPVAYDGDRFDGDYACTLCRGRDEDEPTVAYEPDCPWRQAVEWRAAREALHTFDLAPAQDGEQ